MLQDGLKILFPHYFHEFQKLAWSIADDHGWHINKISDGEAIALMHSELSEALEGLRAGIDKSDKIQEFSNLEEELADVVIRIMDYAQEKGLDIGGAIVAKSEHNKSRPFRHGKKF